MKRVLNGNVETILFKKMNDSCMHDLVWRMNYLMYEFSFAFFLKTNLNCSPFHCYFEFMESFYFDIFFLLFLNNFFGLINLLTNTFLIISFETLFEWHAWNCQGLEKVWMRWWRLIRELPQFELVSGHKMCLGFP